MSNTLSNGLRFYGCDEELPDVFLPNDIRLTTFCLDPKLGPRKQAAADGAGEVMQRLSQNQRVSIDGLSERRKGILKDLGIETLQTMLQKEGAFFFLEDKMNRSLGNLYLNRTGEVVDKARGDLKELGFDLKLGQLADVGGFLVQDKSTLDSAGIAREIVVEQLFLALQHYVRENSRRVSHLMVEVANGNKPMQRVMNAAVERSGPDILVCDNVKSPKFTQLCERTVLPL